METLEKLKKAKRLLSEVIADGLNKSSEKKWFKFLLHSQGVLLDAIKSLEKDLGKN